MIHWHVRSETYGAPLETPWGYIQDARQITPGIVWVSTSSHGGFWLSLERLEQMPAELRDRPGRFNGAGCCWFEEDCEWALVVLAFPEFFDDNQIKAARRMEEANFYERS